MHATKSAQTLVQSIATQLGLTSDAGILTTLIRDVMQFEQHIATATREACNTRVAELEARLQQFEELVDALMSDGVSPAPTTAPSVCLQCHSSHRA